MVTPPTPWQAACNSKPNQRAHRAASPSKAWLVAQLLGRVPCSRLLERSLQGNKAQHSSISLRPAARQHEASVDACHSQRDQNVQILNARPRSRCRAGLAEGARQPVASQRQDAQLLHAERERGGDGAWQATRQPVVRQVAAAKQGAAGKGGRRQRDEPQFIALASAGCRHTTGEARNLTGRGGTCSSLSQRRRHC